MTMHDDTEQKESAIIQEPIELLTQQSASDTSNWDNRVSNNPSGEVHSYSS